MSNKTRAKPTRKTCLKCDKSLPIGDYYNTSDTEYYIDSKIPICKACCQDNIERKGFKGFQDLMRMINKPLLDELFDGDFYKYIKNINSLPQYRGMTFLESTLFKESKELANSRRAIPKELSPEDLRESEDFWGIGKEERDYLWLNHQFADYLSRYEVDGKTLEDLIVEICLTRLDIRKRREDGENVDRQIKSLNDLLTSANLKPSQETGNQASEFENSFGLLIKKWEDTRPIQDDSEWKKNDTLGSYMKTWFTGHLMRFFNIENDDEDEYFEELNKYTVTQKDLEGDKDGRDT